jgi:hypothetical protein
MKFEDAVRNCHVRSAIYREGDKWKISEGGVSETGVIRPKKGIKVLKLYGKNHPIPLEERVPKEDQQFDDWEEYDPEEGYLRG